MAGKLTLGPLLYHWPPERYRDFYFRIADEAALDVVYVGEVVCSKRQPLLTPVLPEVIERLEAAGKQVVLSTLALIMARREVAAVRHMAEDSNGLLVEANDLAACSLLTGKPHVIGPFINLFNEATAAVLESRGARRLCLPVELSATAIAAVAKATQAEIEVQVFGRLPLALSARCYHARSHDLSKDSCRYVCGEDHDGLALTTLDGEPFLAVNGIQTLSYRYTNLSAELSALESMGVSHFRLWPHSCDMVAVADVFQTVLAGDMAPEEADHHLAELIEGVEFANGYLHNREGAAFLGDAL